MSCQSNEDQNFWTAIQLQKVVEAMQYPYGEGPESIPPLRDEEGKWALIAVEKADLFAKVFQDKFHLPASTEIIDDTATLIDHGIFEHGFLLVRTRSVRKLLLKLSDGSATGPDDLPSNILKKCANELVYPITKLVRLILREGIWPSSWKLHWLLPLFKRKSRSVPNNYRGIHLTSQLSKVGERVIGNLLLPRLQRTEKFGPHQFAYCQGRSYKDALTLCVCEWILALSSNCRIGLYCSDVAGAFDKVSSERLKNELAVLGIHENIFHTLCSWLEPRSAHVIVDNKASHHFSLKDMLYQSTVLGPPLWNIFYADARRAVNQA